MTAYSDIINKTVEAAMSKDGFDPAVHAPKVFKLISKIDRERTSVTTISKDLKAAASAIANRAIRQQETAQMAFGFFKLPGAVALDLEGRKIKFTRSLSQIEFKRAAKIRVDNHRSSGEAIKEFDAAEEAVAPYWAKHPDWTFGECLDQLVIDKAKRSAA